MTNEPRARRRPRVQTQSMTEEQQTMDDKFISSSSGTPKTGLRYLTESFSLNSLERTVQRQGKGRKPSFVSSGQVEDRSTSKKTSGRKITPLDISRLGEHFAVYVRLVNMVLESVYKTGTSADTIGKQLSEYRGKGYAFLKKVTYLQYRDNDEIKGICFERMYRNALEQAARIILSDWKRRQLFTTALAVLREDEELSLRLLKNKYISSALINKVRTRCESVNSNGKSYYYAASVLKQIRRVLDERILSEQDEPLLSRKSQRVRVRRLLKSTPSSITTYVRNTISEWIRHGYLFREPKMLSFSEDFSAGSENDIGQGYWYSIDTSHGHENEVLFFLKLPEPVEGTKHEDSPFKTKTLGFRFLDWFPRAMKKDLDKADRAERDGYHQRARQLRFRAAKFEDMHKQLMNTVEYQHITYQLKLLKSRKTAHEKEIMRLESRHQELRNSRKCRPPQLMQYKHKVVLYIPFLPPTQEMIETSLGVRNYRRRAGADRGLRVPIAISVEKDNDYVDELVEMDRLLQKRARLREDTIWLQSEISRRECNWAKKHPDMPLPSHILKKQRHRDAVWARIRRIDREISHQVASRLVWFCEEHEVKTVVFENLKNYSPPSGLKGLSWTLSANLFSKVLEAVRYMRQSIGHKHGGVWMVSPAWTSRTCHQCGARGVRVLDETSTDELKTGEYFFCEKCDEHFHADINASRNIIHVQSSMSSAVPGRSA